MTARFFAVAQNDIGRGCHPESFDITQDKLREGSKGKMSHHPLTALGQLGPKLALLYWICQRPDKGRGRGRIKAVVVFRRTAVFVVEKGYFFATGHTPSSIYR